jgi:GNAT superfamily N-acetyltransferase
MIRDALPWELEHPEVSTVEAIGLCDGADLCAVAAWSPIAEDPETWRHHVLAVRNGRKNRGLGEQILRALLERAEMAGVRVIVSLIHADNERMLKLVGKVAVRLQQTR